MNQEQRRHLCGLVSALQGACMHGSGDVSTIGFRLDEFEHYLSSLGEPGSAPQCDGGQEPDGVEEELIEIDEDGVVHAVDKTEDRPRPAPQLDGSEAAIALHTVHLDELTEQLAKHDSALEGIDNRFSDMSDGIYTHAEHITAEIAKLGTKLDCHGKSLGKAFQRVGELSKLVRGLTGVTMGADFHLQSQVDKLAKRLEEYCTSPRVADWHEPPAPEPKRDCEHTNPSWVATLTSSHSVCEHPNPSWAAVLISSHSVQVLTCSQPGCGAKRLDGNWYVAESASGAPAVKPKPDCEHPEDRRLACTNNAQDEKRELELCRECGSRRYRHPDRGWLRWVMPNRQEGRPVNAMAVSCEPQPTSEQPAAEPKPACEHPKKQVKVEAVCLRGGMMNTEVCECGALYADGWFIPEPPSEKAEAAGSETTK